MEKNEKISETAICQVMTSQSLRIYFEHHLKEKADQKTGHEIANFYSIPFLTEL